LNLFLKYRRLWLLLLGLCTLLFAVGIALVRIDFSFDSFYPKDDEEYLYYQQFQETFFERQNFLIYVAIAGPDGEVFDAAFLRRVDTLFAGMEDIGGVDSVLSPTRIPLVKRRGTSFSQVPYLQFETEAAARASRQRVLSDSVMLGGFITRDLSHVCGYVQIDPAIFDTRQRDEVSRELRRRLDTFGAPYVLSGIPYIRTRYIETIGQELLLFMTLAIAFIALVLFLTYRNIWGVIIPMMAVVISLVWVLGFMGLTGQTVNLINNLLIPLIFVVGTSDVIHLTTKYLSETRAGRTRGVAMRRTMKDIGLAIFLTSVTTAIGFGSLLVSRLPPIRAFGLYAALGVLITYLITVILLPNALLRLPPSRFGHRQAIDNLPLWHTLLLRIDRLTRTRSRALVLSFSGVLLVCGWYIVRIPTDTHLIEDIGKGDPIRESMTFFEAQGYGLRPFELGLRAKHDSIPLTDRRVLVEMSRMQDWLADQHSFSPFLSVASLVEQVHYLDHFSRPAYRSIPEEQATVDEYLDLVRLRSGEDLLQQVVSQDGQQGRISARLPDIGTNAFDQLYAGLDRFYRRECDTTLFTYRPTGHAFLTEHNLVYVRRSLLGGLSLAFVIVGAIMGLLFRSWRMLLASMLPNVVPLLLTGGVMGLFGITLTASTTLVFVIAFGVAVDDTIHFLTRYRLERQQGHDVDTAIRHTLLGTGKAMIITSLILMAGFVMLMFSNFGGTFSTGLFTGLTVLFALLADLLLLPVLLRWLQA
jgi:hypothetical protein